MNMGIHMWIPLQIPKCDPTITDSPLEMDNNSIAYTLVVVLAVVLILLIALSVCCICSRKYPGGSCCCEDPLEERVDPASQKWCPLCLQQVSILAWESGSHRATCFRSHERLVASFPDSPCDLLTCPRCGWRLKLWPRRGHLLVHTFSCEGGSSCPHRGRQIQSHGDNRFCCYFCDYNLCKDCAIKKNRELERQQRQQQELRQSLADASSKDRESESPPPPYSDAMKME